MACLEARCGGGARLGVSRVPLRRAAARPSPARHALPTTAAAGGVKSKPVPQTSDDAYIYTPRGKRVKKPTNAAEQFFFDFYYKEPELSDWEKKLKAFTEENFRGIRLWAQIHRELRAARVKTVSPEATAAAVASRREPGPLDALLGPPPVLLDVREEVYHRKARPDGSVNVPLYKQLTEPKNSYEWARVVSFGLLALRPPVRNEEFIQDVSRLVGGKKNTPIYVICASGGTLETASERKARRMPTWQYDTPALTRIPALGCAYHKFNQIRAPNIPAPIFGEYGAASRSLLACHELVVKGGFTNVVHVEGGYSAWVARKLPGDWDA